jgi:hypothetical protein
MLEMLETYFPEVVDHQAAAGLCPWET